MQHSFGLRDRTVLVTGGASGIGKSCVEALAREGAKVAVADINADGAGAVAEAVTAGGGRALALSFDVTDPAATAKAFDRAEADLGPLDGLIAAAGIARAAPAEDVAPETWQAVIGINLTGLFYTVQAAGRRMLPRGRGSIVTFGSTSSIGGQAGRAAYCASKAGVVGLTRDLAIEWGSHGVRVNAVGPSVTDTPMVRGGLPERFLAEVVEDRTPLARLGQPEEVANACLFLLSDLSSYITGTLLMIDGGVSAGFFTRRHGRDLSSKALLGAGVYQE